MRNSLHSLDNRAIKSKKTLKTKNMYMSSVKTHIVMNQSNYFNGLLTLNHDFLLRKYNFIIVRSSLKTAGGLILAPEW
jgi:hypothetical protein